MKLTRFLALFAAIATICLAETIDDANETQAQLEEITAQIAKIDARLDSDNNVWIKQFIDQRDFLALQTEQTQIDAEIKQLSNKRDSLSKQRREMLEERAKTLRIRLDLLSDSSAASPYDSVSKIDPIPDAPEVKNPFAIIGGFSYIREGSRMLREQQTKLRSLRAVIADEKERQALLERQNALLLQLKQPDVAAKYAETIALLTALNNIEEVLNTALSVQEKRFSANEAQIKAQIEGEISKLISIAAIAAVIIALGFLLKLVVKRTVTDANRIFSINRAANIATFFVIALVLLFNYINNIVYFVTLLGFISAGIAIAMKDWFMSLLGWLVIVIGGSVHIGDRIRIVREGDVVVGDVLEIGLTRIMLFEDITLATFDRNRRAGRIIHVPNNYVFTNIIQNYTYNEMQTVWDGVDITVTFDSNHKKARKIAKEIAAKHAIGYTDQTRKHYNNLRMRFNFRAVSVEPRVFTFAHIYGVKVSVWYLTNSYATLSLRSVISAEIIEAFNAADGVTIAYPTYALGRDSIAFPPPLLDDASFSAGYKA
ncbi:MAG: mechanosensitive ion channel [Helicobacteraceae bacterium]|jgi:small-conductance mechanosensitive channel|nr:mechanosensitive ion channel [Helicobacteraceae bacterium]